VLPHLSLSRQVAAPLRRVALPHLSNRLSPPRRRSDVVSSGSISQFPLGYTDIVLRLRANGFEVTGPVASMSSLQAYVTDPAGNRVELCQPLFRAH
jgi:hypothetical protein